MHSRGYSYYNDGQYESLFAPQPVKKDPIKPFYTEKKRPAALNSKFLHCQGMRPFKQKLVKSPLLKHKKKMVQSSNQKLVLPSPELRYKGFSSKNRGLDKFYKDRQHKMAKLEACKSGHKPSFSLQLNSMNMGSNFDLSQIKTQ